jgi:protein-S-isoprenylcysteine O-methyltransferase Ste14
VRAFRPAKAASAAWNLAKTAAQAAVFWSTFLVVGPWLIAQLEGFLGLSPFRFTGQGPLAGVLAVAFGGLNLASGTTMAVVGRGTPFPLDTPRELVIRGPYRFARNPMAIGGLGLGAAVGLWLGSLGTLLYVVAGGVLWQLIARPLEERDLQGRFGDDYARYRESVRCWWPRLRAYIHPSDS